jgi:hypothetical protein
LAKCSGGVLRVEQTPSPSNGFAFIRWTMEAWTGTLLSLAVPAFLAWLIYAAI